MLPGWRDSELKSWPLSGTTAGFWWNPKLDNENFVSHKMSLLQSQVSLGPSWWRMHHGCTALSEPWSAGTRQRCTKWSPALYTGQAVTSVLGVPPAARYGWLGWHISPARVSCPFADLCRNLEKAIYPIPVHSLKSLSSSLLPWSPPCSITSPDLSLPTSSQAWWGITTWWAHGTSPGAFLAPSDG